MDLSGIHLAVFQKAVIEFAPLCNIWQNCAAGIRSAKEQTGGLEKVQNYADVIYGWSLDVQPSLPMSVQAFLSDVQYKKEQILELPFEIL